MMKLAFGALFVGLLAACGGGGGNNNKVTIVDSGGGSADSGTDVCNVLTQTGCASGEKCSWVQDATDPQPLGHIACVPDGSVALGGACTYGAAGASGYDNCSKGLVCNSGVCKTICDQNGGDPMCPTGTACGTYEGLFGPVGQPVAAGVCDPTCNPLTDNDFDGSGSDAAASSGACGSGAGCYGYPSDTTPSRYTCVREVNTTLHHRDACTTASGCANSGGNPYLNGCAQGYLPLLYDMTGSTQVDCIAMCAAASCYSGQCGTNNANLTGAAPHQCVQAQNGNGGLGTFNPATTNNNGDQCMYSWLFEIDSMGNFVKSDTSDTVGFCVDHSKYKYDSNGDGQVNSSDMSWPGCNTLTTPGFGSGSALGAADFGCVDSTTAGLMVQGKAKLDHVTIDRPRTLYHRFYK